MTNQLRNMLAMATMIGGPNGPLDMPNMGGMSEDDPKWNGVEKIPPSICFLSVGPGELADRFYPCIMAPKDSPMVKPKAQHIDENDEYVTLAKLKFSYETREEAMVAVGSVMTSVAILNEDGTFDYPYYKYSPSAERVMRQAQDRRERRAEKLKRNHQG